MDLSKKKHALAKKISYNEGKGKNLTPRDKKLSIRHLKDSIKYNEQHAKDHEEAAKIDKKILKEK